MATVTHICTLDYVAKMLGEDPELLEAIVYNDDNLTYGSIISVYTGPDEAIMLGDTPYDVTAAGRAGVRCVALRCGGWGDDDLRDAVAVYDDPADLLAHYDQSPFARG